MQLLVEHNFITLVKHNTEVEEKLLNISEQLKTLGLIKSTVQADLNTYTKTFQIHAEHTGEIRELLREFNYYIHHLEDISRGYNGKRFLFTCEDEGIDLPEQAYEMFTIQKSMVNCI